MWCGVISGSEEDQAGTGGLCLKIPSCHLSVKCGAMSHINATPTTILLVEDATGSYDIDAATEKALEKLPVL